MRATRTSSLSNRSILRGSACRLARRNMARDCITSVSASTTSREALARPQRRRRPSVSLGTGRGQVPRFSPRRSAATACASSARSSSAPRTSTRRPAGARVYRRRLAPAARIRCDRRDAGWNALAAPADRRPRRRPDRVQTLGGVPRPAQLGPGARAPRPWTGDQRPPDHEHPRAAGRPRGAAGRGCSAHPLEGVPAPGSCCAATARCGGTCSRSTLACAHVVAPGRSPVLLLVPALPCGRAGHCRRRPLLERDGVPDAAARDRVRTTTACSRTPSARLLDWAEERCAGFFRASDGANSRSPRCAQAGLRSCRTRSCRLGARGRPAVFGAGRGDARRPRADRSRLWPRPSASGCDVIVRCAPTFAGVLAGTTAREPVPRPRRRACARRLRLVRAADDAAAARLVGAYPGALVEADVGALAADEPRGGDRARWRPRRRELLDRTGLAVVATPRERPRHDAVARDAAAGSPQRSRDVVAGVEPRRRSSIVAKGGITSAVTLQDGRGRSRGRGRRPGRARRLALAAALARRRRVPTTSSCQGTSATTTLLARLVAGLVRGSPVCSARSAELLDERARPARLSAPSPATT